MRSHNICGVWNMRIVASVVDAFINNNHHDENWASTSIIYTRIFLLFVIFDFFLSMRCTEITSQPNCDAVYYGIRISSSSRSKRNSLRLDEDINCCGAPLLQKFGQQRSSLAHRPACAQSYKKHHAASYSSWYMNARAGRPLTFNVGAQNLV